MTAAISQSGSNYNIDITYKYTGSGSAAGNMKLYAALVDKDCTGYSYSSGIPHGYNCWMAWLTAGDTYKSKSSGSGSALAALPQHPHPNRFLGPVFLPLSFQADSAR